MHEETLIAGLTRLLASTLILGCKARFFAWSLKLGGDEDARRTFYEGYAVLDRMCDDLATRVVERGGVVPGSYSVLATLSSIKENQAMEARAMVDQLIRDHERLIADTLFVAVLAEGSSDEMATGGLFRLVEICERSVERLRAITPTPA